MIRLVVVQFLSMLGLKLWPHAEPFFKRYRKIGLLLFLICVLGMLATVFVGCASPSQKATKLPLWTYKADIQISVDGKTFDGMAVTKLDGVKTITIRSKAKLDLLTISSCHREFTQERVDYKSGWFGLGGSSASKYTYTFDPTDIEKEAYCPLYIQAFQVSGLAAWGYISFRTTENLPARTECNGTPWKFAGISVCQSRSGFEQAITFDRPVKFRANEFCKVEARSDRDFRVRAGKGFCRAVFSDGKDTHRLDMLGYDEILVRGE